MIMHLFYTPDITGDEYTLPEEESKHCIRVLRLGIEDTLYLVDGQGGWYRCRITHPHPKQCRVACIEKTTRWGKRNFSIHIAIAPTKNIERFEWFLEKCTEIGVDEITPLLCDHSERKVIKPERLEKVIISAMKQSFKAYLPVLHPLTTFESLIKQPSDSLKCIAHCEHEEKKGMDKLYTSGQNILILIGPEGDFSPREIQWAQEHGFQSITLGESRLRTETAGIVACHSVHFLNAMH
jgi:16S rRNA (uracil1498-N3)-methyltransferase